MPPSLHITGFSGGVELRGKTAQIPAFQSCGIAKPSIVCIACSTSAAMLDMVAVLVFAFYILLFNAESVGWRTWMRYFFGSPGLLLILQNVLRGIQKYYACVFWFAPRNAFCTFCMANYFCAVDRVAICMNIISVGLLRSSGLPSLTRISAVVLCMVVINAVACRLFRDLQLRA